MVATDDTSVYLDLSELDRDPHQAFPGISRICRFFGIDIARDPIPVRPGCHYMIGGLAVDADGRTTVPGLWAVGECASTGLHGANRMGSNSLLESLVLGADVGAATARELDEANPELLPLVGRALRSRHPGVRTRAQEALTALEARKRSLESWERLSSEATPTPDPTATATPTSTAATAPARVPA